MAVKLNLDLTGRKFGRWTAVRYSHFVPNTAVWICKCACGVERGVRSGDLRNGKSVSCGCYSREVTSRNRKTHGQSLRDAKHNLEYRCWKGMKGRCYRKKCKDFPDYGGRGIIVCDRWIGSFENFISDMGAKPSPSHSIERRNVNGNYEPDNCYWGTVFQQANNRRDSVRYLFNGENLTLAEWNLKLGTAVSCLYDRLVRGWSIEKTLTTPSRKVLNGRF